MKVLIISSIENSEIITNNAIAELNFEIDVKYLTEKNNITDRFAIDYDLVIIDDSAFYKYSYQSKTLIFSELIENNIPSVVIINEPDRAESYCSINLIDYFIEPVDWQRTRLRLNIFNNYLGYDEKNIKPSESKVPDKFIIKNKNEVSLVDYDDIRFFEKEGKKLHIHLDDEVIIVYESIKDLMTRIPENFVRVHNSYVVNTKYISKIHEVGNRSYHIMFSDYDKIAHMSRYRSDALLKGYYKLNSSNSG